jgi:hypothetical protein
MLDQAVELLPRDISRQEWSDIIEFNTSRFVYDSLQRAQLYGVDVSKK